ncbi:nicotinamidase-related amidase [Solibacillus kalamii]|uniref:Isochorismatase-like domain-containing protein n=1 Tax=Solibacillus kalamii TaxID=1748298 RepID=A0ABX3ZG97_9BACL|nr:isochorismatase family protein [Solibacillus kalamii]MBM7665974.1 nicotinamidase-related amidase [Solibacillus kalamii]OUZ38482.1 hypothetical protein CBM15_12060 [Solibacillus kalamii]
MQKNYDGFAEVVGFGERPAIIVVDFINGFTDSACKLGSNYDEEIAQTSSLLEKAREHNIPIIFTTVEYGDAFEEAKYFLQKIPALQVLTENSHWVQVDKRLQRRQHELVIKKKFASAFFGTNLNSILTTKKVDTLIIVGCTTSGCIRATVVDALQYGYRAVVPEQCVGDRSLEQHQANLFDIQNKYGDIVSKDTVLHYFNQIKGVQLDV